ncbi:protein of unknown function [Pseudomonas marincola]|uniref:Uncharacterized protein n=1 Tax=Pseudomonas marincola TaxID=437900 RepID=A0A8S2BCL5_9PSED|nr:protein of unknown function [Pseudomonas marincola]
MAATARLPRRSKVRDGLGLRAEFVQLVELAHSLQTSTQATISPTARID